MNSNKIVRGILSVLTLLTLCALLFGTVWGLVVKIPIMFVVCLLLSVGFGFFTYKDIKHYFTKK